MSEACTHDCGNCSSDCGERTAPQSLNNANNKGVKKVIAVVSGKGGVGKSLVTSMLAVSAAKKGLKTAILDADITGPSIPKSFGVHEKATCDEAGTVMYPPVTKSGIKLMSLNLLVENETDPVIWRGPVIANMVKQFWTDVVWGELDYLFVDMPPGTGDVPLTVFQSLPIDGIVIVSSPQDLVQMIVKKAYNMAEMMKIPVVGLVENYSFVKCPDCGKSIYVFGESKADEIGAELNIPVMAKMPLDPNFASMVDAGKFAEVRNEYLSDAVKCLPRA